MNSQEQDNPAEGLGYLLDDRYLLHNPGTQHPESPQRLIAIRRAIQALGDGNRWEKLPPREASPDELTLVHSAAHIERIEQASKLAPSSLDLDTAVSTESYRTALLAAGGVLQAVDAVCTGRLRRVFAFVRPPGHHAGRESARGFCLFNNVAIAAAYARTKYALVRVAIVDIDVHHGNGTQSCFYNDPGVLYISSHQYPFYPGSGNYSEAGKSEGKGYTLNFPLPANSEDSTFVPIYSKLVPAVLDQFAPQLILVSAGLDAHFNDPLGGLSLTQDGYAAAAASLMLTAERLCDGKICFVLEGGYDFQALQDCVHAILMEMEERHPKEISMQESDYFKEIKKQPARFAAGRWKW